MKKLILGIAIIMATTSLQSFLVIPAAAQQTSVTYVGLKENGIVFELKLENEDNQASRFSIKDKAGNVLYEENFKEKTVVQRFLLPSDENSEYTFVVSKRSAKYEKHFSVNRTLVTNINVKEIK